MGHPAPSDIDHVVGPAERRQNSSSRKLGWRLNLPASCSPDSARQQLARAIRLKWPLDGTRSRSPNSPPYRQRQRRPYPGSRLARRREAASIYRLARSAGLAAAEWAPSTPSMWGEKAGGAINHELGGGRLFILCSSGRADRADPIGLASRNFTNLALAAATTSGWLESARVGDSYYWSRRWREIISRLSRWAVLIVGGAE